VGAVAQFDAAAVHDSRQFIIFILGWPLEWTEIIVIFMPIFIPLLAHFNIDPLFFGLLWRSTCRPHSSARRWRWRRFYLKGVSPPHVTLNQIFRGMMPFMLIQVLALVLLYVFPGIGMWAAERVVQIGRDHGQAAHPGYA